MKNCSINKETISGKELVFLNGKAAVPNWPVLSVGNSGINVTALQFLLNFRGYNISADGVYGSNTANAVTQFQTSRGLAADGVAGANTLTAIVVNVANGTNNYAARAAQCLLRKFESIAVDGDFGTNSENATRRFQSAMGITVNGVVNLTTWRYLFGYSAYPTFLYISNSPLNHAEMKVNAQYILNYLRYRNWTKEAICGMLGNMEVESYINPGVWYNCQYGSSAFGLVQWNPPSKYLTWASENGYADDSMIGQLQRIIYEVANGLQFSGYGEFDSFYKYTQSTKSAYELGRQFAWHYEDGNLSYEAADDRGRNATVWYNELT